MSERDQSPPLTISSLDLNRIEHLLAQDEYHHMPGVEGLMRELERANIVDPEEIPPTVVTMNSIVRFKEVSTSREHEMTLVYPRDAGRPGCVSIFAPVGSALLGLSVGQRITWAGPSGRPLELEIEEILYQPESSGELYR